MSDITFTLSDVSWAIGFIAAVISLYFLIKKAFKPLIDMSKKLDNNFNCLSNHEERLNKIDTDISDIKKMLRVLCIQNISTMNHMIDGNGIEQMKKTRDEAMVILSKDDAS